MLLAATGTGLVKVAYACQDHGRVLSELAARVSPRVLEAPSRLEAASRQIEEYLAGRRRRFELSLDWQLASGFRLSVLGRLSDIAYGHTATYSAMAVAAGNPRAVRAAGSACAANPLPIVVPCHRVVRSDGTIGGYAGGSEAKETLLGLEGGTPAVVGRGPTCGGRSGAAIAVTDAPGGVRIGSPKKGGGPTE